MRARRRVVPGFSRTQRTTASHRAGRTLAVMALILAAAPMEAQQLGHRVLGTLGLYAGSQPDSGFYVVNQFLSYWSNDIYDRYGHRIPVDLDLDAVANPVGFQVTVKLC